MRRPHRKKEMQALLSHLKNEVSTDNYSLEYAVLFELYRELHFIYLSHITNVSNILTCHDHFIDSLG